jgi:hypothetical protein
MGIIRFALRFPHSFYVLAALILFLGVTGIRAMRTDIFPEIRIPVVSVICDFFPAIDGGQIRLCVRGKLELGQRRITTHPVRGEIADDERYVDQERARCGKPKANRVEHGKGHITHAELQWHGKVHQPDDEGHRHEKDHERAVGGEDLV